MAQFIENNDFPVNPYASTFLTQDDFLLVECAEIHDDYLGRPELLEKHSFGLTHLGGLTVGLGHEKVHQIVKFNYQIEEQNTVGFCQPYNLVLAPRKFFLNVFTNNFNEETQKYIDDIIEANEKHQKRASIIFDFIYTSPLAAQDGFYIRSWPNEEIKRMSQDNLKNYILTKDLNYTKFIYFVSKNL